MALIITFDKSRRLSTREPLVYLNRSPQEWMLFLPWWTISLHWGQWWPQPWGKPMPEDTGNPPSAN